MKIHYCLPALLLALVACGTSVDERWVDDRRTDFTADWTFRLGDDSLAARADYDDSAWRLLNLPHDWAIEGDFSRDNPSGTGGGALPGGIGWYRKNFVADSIDQGKRWRIDFDGVYMNATVYINGHRLGTRPYGYISFGYDLTPYIIWGSRNVIAVRVDNAEQPNSRWYSGCGIYRNVWLTRTDPLHVAHWGTYVTADEVSKHEARLDIRTTVANERPEEVRFEVVSILLDADGREVARTQSMHDTESGCDEEIVQSLAVDRPHLWSVDTPYLYTLRTELHAAGILTDVYTTPVGIRTFRFDAKEGFILNGERVKINGVCMHHDLGCLGAAVNTRAIERQLQILKAMGCNGIRCSHNPPAPELLDLCDRMGFIVMDETFDMWRKRKTAHDYSRYFDQWHERDLTDLVMRDRNHPSIFMWSIGNEVLEQWTDIKVDTLSLEEANLILNFGKDQSMLAGEGDTMSVNSLLTKKLADMTRALDPTRPVTAGCNEVNPGSHLFRSGALDIIGFNYHNSAFAGVPELFPGKPFLVTESVSALMTRGYYRMPSDSIYILPQRWDMTADDPSLACSSYDNCHVPWGNTHEETWRLVRDNPFISGQYIWTGFDYLGEPTPYGWPARSSYFGIVDLAGFPKDVYYMYQSEWTDKPVLHLFPHWNWSEGETVDLWAYYGGADEVELFINGRSEGVRTKGKDDLHVMWRVKFEPGVLKAVSRRDGKTVLESVIRTAGTPATLRLTPDRSTLSADGKDLCFVTVEVLDKEGNLCPDADNLVNFAISGSGFIAGVDNGSPTSLERFKDNRRKAFHGKCLVVVQNNGQSGRITLTATSEGLDAVTVEIN